MWPTWADIIGREFDCFENWGKPSQGNLFIFNSLNECAVKNNINADDTVVVMWSDIYRNDTYKNNAWEVAPEHGVNRNAMDDRGYLLRDLAYINAAKTMLDHYGATYYFLSMVPISIMPNDTWLNIFSTQFPKSTECDDVAEHYRDAVSLVRPSVFETVFNYDWFSRPLIPVNCKSIKRPRIDRHPSPLEHLEYLDKILPEITINASTRAWVDCADSHVLQDPMGKDPFQMGSYRPWVQSLNEIWQVSDVNRL